MSWLMERHKGRNFDQIMRMLRVWTPLEETRAYQQLVGIGIEKGKKEEAETAQLEARAEAIFDAASL